MIQAMYSSEGQHPAVVSVKNTGKVIQFLVREKARVPGAMGSAVKVEMTYEDFARFMEELNCVL